MRIPRKPKQIETSVPQAKNTSQIKRKGFSLTEAAVVLAVIGLTLGALWVAANIAIMNLRTSDTQKDILLLVRNMQNLITYRDGSTITDGQDLGPVVINGGLAPKSWVFGSVLRSPFGGTVDIYALNDASPYPRFDLIFEEIPKEGCTRLVTNLSSTFKADFGYDDNKGGGLLAIAVRDQNNPGTDTFATTTFPVQVTDAPCANKLNILHLTFSWAMH